MSKVLPLLDIQKMQISDKAGAESWLLHFLQETEDTAIEKVELQPKPESLNSINGFVTFTNKERFFFKSHVEENEKVSEYYNASILAQAGYPVIAARRIKQRPGQQIAFYEVLSLSTLFDRLKEEEDWQHSNPQSKRGDNLVQAQEALDKKVTEILQGTVKPLSAGQHRQAPIHQLFSHRLAEDGRFGLFYKGKTLPLHEGEISFDKLSTMRWQINGVSYNSTLHDIVGLARELLAPKDGPAVIGHGDAHNGNIFVNMDLDSGAPLQSSNTATGPGNASPKLVMFDPAFAGEHDPLLDITKPLFHNHFARWMYFPEQVDKEFDLSYSLQGDQISIEHSYAVSSLRKQLLRIKIKEVVKPLIAHLHGKKMLDGDWRRYLRCAMFCCPFLTVNLLAPAVAGGTLSERYSLTIKLLALSMAVELGCENRTGSNQFAELIDEILE